MAIKREITYWECPYCGKRCDTKEDCELHEKSCGYNPYIEQPIYVGKEDPNTKVRFQS